MSSTITAADLTVTITESITLDEKDYGVTNAFVVEDVNEVYTRIVNVPTSQTALFTFSSTVGAGNMIPGTTQYFRITNKDDTNYVELVINGASNNSVAFRLEAGSSFLFGDVGADGTVTMIDANDSAAITSATFVNLESIKAKANGAAVDLELFAAGV